MPIAWDAVLANNSNPIPEDQIQKKMIFELMARKGYFDTWSDAKLYVKNAKGLTKKREKPDAAYIIREAHRTGGYVIMAHPHLVSEPISYQGNKIHLSVYTEKV